MRWLATVLGCGVAVYAGLALYLYVFQARHIYFPDRPSQKVESTPADIGLAFEPAKLTTVDGETLAGWFIPALQARGTLLYLHGNGGNIAHRLDPIAVFHRLGLNILIFDYRGYGASTGKPSEEGTYRDALAAWHYLTRGKRLPAGQIVLFGESLGGSIAAWLAARHMPAGLVIYASFTSVPEFAQQLYPFLPVRRLVRYHYETRTSLGNVKCPVLIMHSPEDEIIPFGQGRALFAAAHEPKQFVELRGGHNDALLVSRDLYTGEVGKFIDGLLPALKQ
jgi:fermentation-respiration switch protein FrsA (DUF1100 family)